MLIPVRLIETTTTRAQVDLLVDSDTPETAAAVVAAAHRRSVERGSGMIVLPDGTTAHVDAGPLERALALVLLDEQGAEIRPLEVPQGEPFAPAGTKIGKRRPARRKP